MNKKQAIKMFRSRGIQNDETVQSSLDEEGQFDDVDVDTAAMKDKFMKSLFQCFIFLIPKLAAASFTMVLMEVVLLMVVADNNFIEYFLRWVGDISVFCFQKHHDINLKSPF